MEFWIVGSPCPRCGRIVQADRNGMPIVHLPEECLQLLRIDRDRYREEKQEWIIEAARWRRMYNELQVAANRLVLAWDEWLVDTYNREGPDVELRTLRNLVYSE